MNLPKINWKGPLKNALTYGLALELAAIGGGYYLYREYKTDKEFRDKVDEQFPFLASMYGSISGKYVYMMPKNLRDKVLDKDDIEKFENPEPSIEQIVQSNADVQKKKLF